MTWESQVALLAFQRKESGLIFQGEQKPVSQIGQTWTLTAGWAGGTSTAERLQWVKQHSKVMKTTENTAFSNRRVG